MCKEGEGNAECVQYVWMQAGYAAADWRLWRCSLAVLSLKGHHKPVIYTTKNAADKSISVSGERDPVDCVGGLR